MVWQLCFQFVLKKTIGTAHKYIVEMLAIPEHNSSNNEDHSTEDNDNKGDDGKSKKNGSASRPVLMTGVNGKNR